MLDQMPRSRVAPASIPALEYCQVRGEGSVRHPDADLNKTAELSQRRPRDAPNIWVPRNVSRVLTTQTATFPEFCNGLFFRSILRMCVQNLKFLALPVPGIIGGTQKIGAVPGYAHASFSAKFFMGFCSDGPCEYIGQICSRSFSRS